MSTLLDRVMNEPIRMVGFPQIIVTRGWCYQFLKGCGWETTGRDRSRRGPRFDTADYAAFGRPKVDEPLTEESLRDLYMGQIRADYVRE